MHITSPSQSHLVGVLAVLDLIESQFLFFMAPVPVVVHSHDSLCGLVPTETSLARFKRSLGDSKIVAATRIPSLFLL